MSIEYPPHRYENFFSVSVEDLSSITLSSITTLVNVIEKNSKIYFSFLSFIFAVLTSAEFHEDVSIGLK